MKDKMKKLLLFSKNNIDMQCGKKQYRCLLVLMFLSLYVMFMWTSETTGAHLRRERSCAGGGMAVHGSAGFAGEYQLLYLQ